MERDVVAKTQAAASGGRASQPGVAASPSAAAGLSQMERDVVTKTQAVSGGRASQPGAVSSTNAAGGLSQMERDVVAKTQASSDGRSSQPETVSSGLSQLERDVVAKNQARGSQASRPGAAPSGGAAAGLSQMERDIVAKTQAAGDSSRGGTDHHASSPAAGLTQLEQDARAKSQARSSRSAVPGVVSEASGLNHLEEQVRAKTQSAGSTGRPVVPAPNTSLSQMEQDVIAKNQARPGGSSGSRPGAAPGGSLSQLEQDVMAKSRPTQSRNSDTDARLSQMEQDVRAKAQLKAPPSSSAGYRAAGLDQMEQDILAKNQSRSDGATQPGIQSSADSRLRQLEDAVAAKTQSGMSASMSPPAPHGLSQMEQDIMSKSYASGGQPVLVGHAQGSSGAGDSLEQLEQDMLAKQQAAGPREYGETISINQIEQVQDGLALKARISSSQGNTAAAMASARPGVQPAAVASMRELEDELAAKSRDPQIPGSFQQPYGDSYPTDHGPSDVAPVPRGAPIAPFEVEMPLYPGSSSDTPFAPNGGIEAFVAETVIAPTGVDVIMSEEEEEELERKKQRKLLFGGCGCLFVVVVAVVVAVVLAGGGDTAELVPTQSPTIPPTQSPTLAPTTVALTALTECLREFSGNAFTDRSSPQFRAAVWMSDEDIFAGVDDCPSQKFLERYALATFYFALDGPGWESCNQNNPECAGKSPSKSIPFVMKIG